MIIKLDVRLRYKAFGWNSWGEKDEDEGEDEKEKKEEKEKEKEEKED